MELFKLKMGSAVFSFLFFEQNLDTDYCFGYVLSLIMCERAGKIIARMLCFMHQSTFIPNNNLITMYIL